MSLELLAATVTVSIHLFAGYLSAGETHRAIGAHRHLPARPGAAGREDAGHRRFRDLPPVAGDLRTGGLAGDFRDGRGRRGNGVKGGGDGRDRLRDQTDTAGGAAGAGAQPVAAIGVLKLLTDAVSAEPAAVIGDRTVDGGLDSTLNGYEAGRSPS